MACVRNAVMLIAMCLTLLSCASKAPDCDSQETKDLVLKISKQELDKLFPDGNLKDLNVINTRTSGFNKTLGSYECSADLRLTGPKGAADLPITYKSELADGGKKFYVTVQGISFLELMNARLVRN